MNLPEITTEEAIEILKEIAKSAASGQLAEDKFCLVRAICLLGAFAIQASHKDENVFGGGVVGDLYQAADDCACQLGVESIPTGSPVGGGGITAILIRQILAQLIKIATDSESLDLLIQFILDSLK